MFESLLDSASCQWRLELPHVFQPRKYKEELDEILISPQWDREHDRKGASKVGIVYRQARLDDAAAASRILAEAINDLNRRHGFELQVTANPQNPYFVFCAGGEPEGTWVAEDAGEVVAFSMSWIRGSFWFLSQLFVLPGYQGQGIGRFLLEKALAYHGSHEIMNRALITFAYNPTSISLYARFGLYPREPMYVLAADAANVSAHPKDGVSEGCEKVSGRAVLAELRGIDQEALGLARDRDHSYLSNVAEVACYLFRKDGIPHGYAYIWKNGRIGPLAVRSTTWLPDVLSTSFRLALMGNPEQVSILVTGSNEPAMALALRQGLRITTPFLWMSSRPLENLACYLFYSPGFM